MSSRRVLCVVSSRALCSASLVALTACSGSQSSHTASNAPAHGDPPAQSASTGASAGVGPPPASAAPANNDSREMNVSGQRGDPGVIDVPGQSDLPAQVPSTAQPYLRVVDAAVAPIRTALASCMDAMGATAPRFYRVTVELDGQLTPRAPQTVALPARVASCAEAVVRGTTVNPPPPMIIPYDIFYARAR